MTIVKFRTTDNYSTIFIGSFDISASREVFLTEVRGREIRSKETRTRGFRTVIDRCKRGKYYSWRNKLCLSYAFSARAF